MRHLGLVATAVLLAGCTVGPDYRRPAVLTPAAFRGVMAPTAAPFRSDRILDARAQVTIARSNWNARRDDVPLNSGSGSRLQ